MKFPPRAAAAASPETEKQRPLRLIPLQHCNTLSDLGLRVQAVLCERNAMRRTQIQGKHVRKARECGWRGVGRLQLALIAQAACSQRCPGGPG